MIHDDTRIGRPIQELVTRAVAASVTDVDVSSSLTSGEWTDILHVSYQLAETTRFLRRPNAIPLSATTRWIYLYLLLQAYSQRYSQSCIDGYRNIWIIKAPAACRGCGIKLMYRLDDILQSEKAMSGRTVQKYIESPHLISHPQNGLAYKYDLRIWCLVTSFCPLQAYAFSGVYGRQCAIPYSDTTQSLGDLLIHLTNYSLQKQHAAVNTAHDEELLWVEDAEGLDAVEPVLINSHVSKLRNTCNAGGKAAKVMKKELLVSHAKILEQISQSHLNGEHRWKHDIWPKIKHKMHALLQATASFVTPRPRSFEFLGFDVLLDEALEPWILEVNMSPAMAHRNEEQSALIACMAKQMIDIILEQHGLNKAAEAPSTIFGKWEEISYRSKHNFVATKPKFFLYATTDSFSGPIAGRMNRPQRLKSASRRRTVATVGRVESYTSNVSNDDLAVVGKSISLREVKFADLCCTKFGCVLLLQRYVDCFFG